MALTVIFAVLSAVLISVRIFLPGQKGYVGIALKTALSALFVILSVVGFCSSGGGKTAVCFLLGLLSCMVGDILLEVGGKTVFAVGAAFFGGGHLFYIAGYLITLLRDYGGEGLRDRGPLLFAAVCLVLIAGFGIFKLKIPKSCFFMTVAYLAVLSMMCAMAILFSTVSGKPIFGVAAGLFVCSDVALAVGLYGEKKSLLSDIFCLYPYYLSQLLLAFAIAAL